MEDSIDECIGSVERVFSRSTEIIIIDDGSDDGTGMICKKWVGKCDNVQYIRTNNNGVSSARNYGISLAKGEWILFIDGDDVLPDIAFDDLVSSSNSDADIVVGNYIYVSEKSEAYEEFYSSGNGYLKKSINEYVSDILIGSKKIHANIGVPWAKMYKRKFLTDNSIVFPVGLKRMQDSVFNLYAFSLSNSVYYLSKPIYCYRYRKESSVHRFSPDFANTIERLLYEIHNFCQKNGCLQDEDIKKTINTKKTLLFIEWCRLVSAHRDCQWRLKRKLSEIKKQKRILLANTFPISIRKVAFSKLIVLIMFWVKLDFVGYLMIRIREL